MSRITSALLAFALVALLALGGAAAAPALVPVGDFDAPIHAASPPQDPSRLFVVERGGTVRVVRNGLLLPRAFLDISGEVATDGERGLLSIAFPPDYRRSHRFYVDYVDRAGHQRVDELRRGSRRTRRVLDLGRVGTQHHGGQLQFGPTGAST